MSAADPNNDAGCGCKVFRARHNGLNPWLCTCVLAAFAFRRRRRLDVSLPHAKARLGPNTHARYR
jgi:hypothetical protein